MDLSRASTDRRLRRLASVSADVALASDRWFVGALGRADSGARWLKSAARRLGEQPARLWQRVWPQKSPRERLLGLLTAEARRAHCDVSQPTFRLFSERIAVLLDLVFTGAVAVDDIAFEAAPSAEIGEEMTDDADGDQSEKEQPLRVEQESGSPGPVSGRQIA